MMITIELPDDLLELLKEYAARENLSVECAAADIVRRRLAIDQFHTLCTEVEKHARAAGYTNEDDILRDIS